MSIGKLFGVVARGEVEPVDGAPVVTQFMTVAGLPLIPIVSWYAADVARQEGLFEHVTGIQEDDVIGVRRRLHGRSVLFGYVRGWLVGAAVALGLVLFIECVDHRPLWGRDPEKFGAMTGGLAAALLLAGLTIPLGRRSRPRDAAIRRALGSVLGVPADLAALHPLDVARWRNVVSHRPGARDRERIIAGQGPPAHAGHVAEALAQVRLELAKGDRDAGELERCTDALLERLASAPPPPAPGQREPSRWPEHDEEDDDERELDPALLQDPQALVRHLRDQPFRVEQDAEEALRALGPAAIPALVAALDDEERKYAAHDLLVELGAAAVPAVMPLLADQDRRLDASMLLEEIGRPAVPALVEALRAGDAATADAALDLLRDLKAPEAIEPAVERAARGDLSWYAIGRLGELDRAATFDAIHRRLDATEDRLEALDALLQLDAARGIDVVLGLARAAAAADPAAATDPEWSCEPLEALGGLGARAPVGPLLAAADEPVPGIRGSVLFALGWLTADPAARARLERAAREDPCEDIRDSAESALARGSDPSGPPACGAGSVG